jgi:predicted nucleotidyltransferase component of viral defense system
MLVEVAPLVFENSSFALKGGTAINLFLRDMPRLSVDLVLVFTNHQAPRAEALSAINEGLRAIRDRLLDRGFDVQAVSVKDMGETKLLVRRDDLAVKIEVNTGIRGTIHPTRIASLTPAASDALMADLELPLLSPEEIYGGKLVAAMDRQHPRDLFDVMELFEHGGVTPQIRRAFVVYLASHNRPLHEVLFPRPKDIRLPYEGSFAGMTRALVSLDALLETREKLFRELPASLDADERDFLRTLALAQPDWLLFGIPHLKELPAIRWRLQNLEILEQTQPDKLREMAAALDAGLG